jgi:TRAP transporter TAXI family solute receptor
MKTNLKISLFFLLLLFAINTYAKEYVFYSGPSGGIFQYYISGIISIAKKCGYKVKVSASNGAVENLRNINLGKADFSITYAGLLSNNKLDKQNVRILGCLYGSPAQLIVRKDSEIHTIYDLKNKRVGVGSIGSGAEYSIEELLKYLNIWEDILVRFIGYDKASEEFIKGNLDAFWVLSGIPNSAIVKTSEKTEIRLVDFYSTLKETHFLSKKSYYSETIIPTNTYKNQTKQIKTFQDKAVLIANKKVPSDVVYNLLSSIYSKEGLNFLSKIHISAKNITIDSSINCINSLLHPAAKKFWQDKNLLKN